jgi:hypothetical protein
MLARTTFGNDKMLQFLSDDTRLKRAQPGTVIGAGTTKLDCSILEMARREQRLHRTTEHDSGDQENLGKFHFDAVHCQYARAQVEIMPLA